MELFLLGVSNSEDYPTTVGTHDSSFASSTSTVTTPIHNFVNGVDIVVTKFSADGSSLEGSTFYGGSDIDGLNINRTGSYDATTFNYGDSFRGEIILDSSGNCLIGTSTWSGNLDGAIDTLSGSQDGLIVKFNSNLDSVIWAQYIGGSARDAIYSLKVMPDGNIIIGGGTTSLSGATIRFPTTTGAYQTTPGGDVDGFLAVISEDGKTIERSTLIGTSSYDQVYFIEFDRENSIYGYGQTESNNFTVLNSSIANNGTGQFFVKLDSSLENLEMSTTFGDGSSINISPTAFFSR